MNKLNFNVETQFNGCSCPVEICIRYGPRDKAYVVRLGGEGRYFELYMTFCKVNRMIKERLFYVYLPNVGGKKNEMD